MWIEVLTVFSRVEDERLEELGVNTGGEDLDYTCFDISEIVAFNVSDDESRCDIKLKNGFCFIICVPYITFKKFYEDNVLKQGAQIMRLGA